MIKCKDCSFYTSCKDYREECEYFKLKESVFSVGYKYETIPFKHQVEATLFAINKLNGALFMEMGTGKTKVILDIILNSKPTLPILIVCPLSGMVVWEKEIRKHASELAEKFLSLSYNPSYSMFEGLKKAGKNIIITNYEKVRDNLKVFLKERYDMIVLDESTYIKNLSAKITKAFIKLRHNSERRFILTGSPIVKNEMDLWSQFCFLDGGKTLGNFSEYRYKYFDPDIYGHVWEPKEGAHEAIAKVISKKVFRVELASCTDLPPIVYEERFVKLTPEQKHFYQSLLDEFRIKLNENVNYDIKYIVSQITFLQEICTGFWTNPQTKEFYHFPCQKFTVLSELLEEIPKDSKVVVWVNFIDSLTQVSDLLTRLEVKHVVYHGSLSKETRDENLEHFQEGSVKVFLGQVSTGAFAIDLSIANYAIYFANSYSGEDRIQSEARLHRIGQKKTVTVIDLITKDSIDEAIIACLDKKENILRSICDYLKGG